MSWNIKEMASVILPTYNRYEVCLENLNNILQQKYSPLEVIVCDDSDKDYFEKNVKSFKEKISKLKNVKYIYSARFDHKGKKDYGLARARNFGVIESRGEYLVFLDDRITPAEDRMINVFVKHLKALNEHEKVWFFGDKGAHKEAFVENCSAIKRHQLVDAGMFCERVDRYGGMTRELIGRFKRQGFKMVYLPGALAKQVCKSRDRAAKKEQIKEMGYLLHKLTNR